MCKEIFLVVNICLFKPLHGKKYTCINGLFIEETMALMKKIHCDSNIKKNKGVAN